MMKNTLNQRALLSVAWAFYAQATGDRVGTIERARQALKLLPASNQLLMGLANSMLGLAYWANGDLEEAGAHMVAHNHLFCGRLAAASLQSVAPTFWRTSELRRGTYLRQRNSWMRL